MSTNRIFNSSKHEFLITRLKMQFSKMYNSSLNRSTTHSLCNLGFDEH